MFRMLFQAFRVDDYVIEVDFREVSEGSQYLVYGPLESGGGIAQSEWHDFELKASELSLKSCPRDVLTLNPGLVTTLGQIDLRKDRETHHLVDPWKGVFVLLRNLVEGHVVSANRPSSWQKSLQIQKVTSQTQSSLLLDTHQAASLIL